MTQAQLQQKLQEAINDIIDESINKDTLDPNVRRQLEEGVSREATKKAQRIFEYLQQHVFQRLSELEGRVAGLEGRVTILDGVGLTGETT